MEGEKISKTETILLILYSWFDGCIEYAYDVVSTPVFFLGGKQTWAKIEPHRRYDIYQKKAQVSEKKF